PEIRVSMELNDIEENEEPELEQRRKSKRRNTQEQPSLSIAPAHVHGSEWKDMLSMTGMMSVVESTAFYDSQAFARSRSRAKSHSWMEHALSRRECTEFVPSQKYLNKCGCGRTVKQHKLKDAAQIPRMTEDENGDSSIPRAKWSILKNTTVMPSNAFGTIQFENVGVQSEARYARLSFDSDPSSVVRLLQAAWRMKPPKLIVTIHGGLTNFELQPKLERALRRGLMKAAQACDTWIITTGVHQGAVQHVCTALANLRRGRKGQSKVAAIGIAPWGLIKKRNRLVGNNNNVHYSMNVFANGRYLELDNAHSHFLLADNGTVGRYGAEVILRRRLEAFLATGSAPVVAVVVEGGEFAVTTVHDYLTRNPSIPVVVCDGSGRASDLLAFTQTILEEQGSLSDSMRVQLLTHVKGAFHLDDARAERALRQIVTCAEKKALLNVYRLGEGMHDVDHAIFTALMKGTNLDRMKLALAWNRVDIARSHIFGGDAIWNKLEMHEALMYALLHNRVDFVHLILENGVTMQNFLTFERLEQLYNSDLGPAHTLHSLTKSDELSIPMIGAVMEKLMGRSFRSIYTSQNFVHLYSIWKNRPHPKTMSVKKSAHAPNMEDDEDDEAQSTEMLFAFERPFHELLIWAVLTKRQDMAILMWKHGEEALAKALVATRLYSSLAHFAADEYLELTLCDELRKHALTFETLARDFLEELQKVGEEATSNLLTYELKNWGSTTVLSLASTNHDRFFMGHPSCQNIINEIWNGGMVHAADFMVLAGICFPPLILTSMEFKSQEELQTAPQTAVEYEESLDTDSESSESANDYSSDEGEDSSSDEEKGTAKRKPRSSSIAQAQSALHQLAAHTLPAMIAGARPGRKASRSSTHKSQSRRQTLDSVCSDFFECVDEEEHSVEMVKKTPLSWTQKISAFYTAPITTFYLWELAFFFFQIVLAYVILVRTDPERIHWEEYYLIAYVVVFGCDLIRKFLVYDVQPFSLKLYKFVISFRNGLSILAVVTYCIGFGFRCFPDWIMMGRVIIIMNSVLWSLKFIEYIAVYRLIGPYVNMASEMIPSCTPMIVLLSVAMLSYGVVRQAITYPYEDWNIILIRNLFLKPYYMVYGEVYAAEIDTCNDGMWDYHLDNGISMWDINQTMIDTDPDWNCVPGHWVSPLYMTFFMLISFVLFLNSMVASCTWVYEHRVMYTKEIFLLDRFRIVMDFESKPFLPPPFSIISHIFMIFKYIVWRCSRKSKGQRFVDSTLKTFLSPEREHALHRFESQVLDDWERRKDFAKKHSDAEHVIKSSNRSEQIVNQLTSLTSVKESTRDLIKKLDQRLTKMENERDERLSALASIAAQIERLTSSSSSSLPSHLDVSSGSSQQIVDVHF
ncbi:hypothetical protein PENTCL1PPCAC_14921, partial [Pristionchus entomophagus]